MSVLYLVRHGQASAGSDDYDRLSPLGEEQSRALGEHWARAGARFDRVYVGPLRRQRQTCEAVTEVFRRRGVAWPEPIALPELDEHHGPAVIAHHRARLAREAGVADPDADGAGEAERLRRYLKVYQLGTHRWVRGELETPEGLEPWAHFRARVEAGIGRVVSAGGRGQRVAAFTSGGATAAAVGLALDLDEAKVLELSWRIRNGSVTELLFTRGRLTLHTFNVTAHLAEERLLTYI